MILTPNIGFKSVRGKSKQGDATSQLLINDHYYTFDESTGDLLDNTGSADGTLFGSITRSKTGVLNEAYGFNGSNTYVSIPGVNNEFTGSFSVGVWAKFTVSPVDFFRIAQNRSGGALGTKKGWQISGINDNYSNTIIDDGNGNSISFSDVTFNEADGNYHFYALTFNQSTGEANFYIDTVLKSTKTNANLVGVDLTSTDDFEIARSSSGNQYFNGDLDEGYIYKGVWTQQQITDYYNLI